MSEPYYSDEWVTLYHGDCREITDWLAADVLVTDPPYGTRLQSKANGNAGGYGRRQIYGRGRDGFTIAGDDDTTTRDAALALWGDRPAILFGSPRVPDPPIAVTDRLVWNKKRLGMNAGPWRYQHEAIYVTAGFERRSDAATSILSAFPDQLDHVHGKPLGLMAQLVDVTPLGCTIADPFAGTGTTLVAAKQADRRSIGIEIDERYCEIAAKRLSQGVLSFDGAAS